MHVGIESDSLAFLRKDADARLSILPKVCLLISFLVFSAFFDLVFVTALRAESITYCGLTISLDLLRPIDAENVQVAIGSNEQIMPQASIEHWAAEVTLLDASRRSQLVTRELVDFIFRCLESESLQVKIAVLSEILRREDSNVFSVRKFLELKGSSQEVVASTLESPEWENSIRDQKSHAQVRVAAELLAELLVVDPQRVKSKSLRLYYFLSEAIFAVLFERFREELASDNLGYFVKLNESLDIFGEDSSGNILNLKQASSIAQIIISDPLNFDRLNSVALAMQAADSEPSSKQLVDLLYPKFSSKVIAEISQFLVASNLNEAIKYSSLFLPKHLTPETILSVTRILDQLESKPAISIEEASYNIFESYSNLDSNIRERYEALLEARFIALIESNDFDNSEVLFSRLLKIRPNPNLKNDALLFKQALLYRKNGLDLKSLEKQSQIQTKLSLYQHLQLFFAKGIWSFIICAGVFISLFAIVLICKSGLLRKLMLASVGSPKQSTSTQKQSKSDNLKEDTESASTFVKMERMRVKDPNQIEYEKNLTLLGLKKTASLRDIKAAYRSEVKSCHPDINPNQSEAESRRFSYITKIYENLIELRKQLGMAD